MSSRRHCHDETPALDRAAQILLEGLERRMAEIDRQIQAAAVAFRAVNDQQQTVRELLAVVMERAKA